ncbi:helix-turn-helix domain-containing protein [Mycobacteroides abscessus]|uniref:helix-turn-helix domain-containing protein n=1 Tax=Mycobacteroides abscessus TaxID=36809 RepID=UPI001C71A5DC|nr:XRE family transcriptional regulator [Mycobacteroides abscessus]
MAEEPQKKNPLGPTGKTVADNIRRLRGDMQYVKLAERLAEIGRPIPTLGLRKIENCDRRVDADDLVALAVALEVSPETLLMPYAENADDEVCITGWHPTYASEIWRWMQTDISLGWSDRPDISAERALPPFVYRKLMEEKAARLPELKAEFEKRKRAHAKQHGEVSDGDDQ